MTATLEQPEQETLHIISALVENHFGVLSRVAGMFAARSFNIESLTVGPTHDATCSRITVTVKGETSIVDQVRKQMEKLAEVIKIEDLSEVGEFVERELVLVKVSTNERCTNELMLEVNDFRPQVVDLTVDTITMQVVATTTEIGRFLELLAPFGIREVARTGTVALMRGAGGLHTSFLAE